MGGYQSAPPVPCCSHGAYLFERCPACDEARSVPTSSVMIAFVVGWARSRRWFDSCAFCRRGVPRDASGDPLAHDAECSFQRLMGGE